MPGPIVLAIVRLLRYWPFAPDGLGAVDRVDERGEVLDERLGLEARLADRDVDDRALVDLELDPAALDLA